MAIFAFITGIIIGAALTVCTVTAHSADELDEIIEASLATANLAENYANRLAAVRNKILDHGDLLGSAATTEMIDIINGRTQEKK